MASAKKQKLHHPTEKPAINNFESLEHFDKPIYKVPDGSRRLDLEHETPLGLFASPTYDNKTNTPGVRIRKMEYKQNERMGYIFDIEGRAETEEHKWTQKLDLNKNQAIRLVQSIREILEKFGVSV